VTLTVGSLFSGIGGLELGLERAGMKTVWQVERDPYARRVLERHWPDVPRWDDVRTFPPDDGRDWHCDLICGGFPCQDISKAGNVLGKRRGLAGERSGLWSEYLRIVRRLRPRFVLVENVPQLLIRGLERVLGDLAALGLDAEWHCIPAAAVGAPHIRDRVFILAHADSERIWLPRRSQDDGPPIGLQGASREWKRLWTHPHEVGPPLGVGGDGGDGPWQSEPRVGRVADGLPGALDRLRCLGNAVVPQVSEFVGRRILAALEANP
jgi:DNA (cytosine-5)-methyltransferase 1